MEYRLLIVCWLLLTAFGKVLQNKTSIGSIGNLKAEMKVDRKFPEILGLAELENLSIPTIQVKLKKCFEQQNAVEIFPGNQPWDKHQTTYVSFLMKHKVSDGFQVETTEFQEDAMGVNN